MTNPHDWFPHTSTDRLIETLLARVPQMAASEKNKAFAPLFVLLLERIKLNSEANKLMLDMARALVPHVNNEKENRQ